MIGFTYIQLLLFAPAAANTCRSQLEKATWKFHPTVGEEILYVDNVSDCKARCWEDLGKCQGYTFTSNGVVGSCYLFHELNGIHACETCSSGVTYEVVEGACTFDVDNELTEVKTDTVEECYQQCVGTPDCKAFTWYDASSPFRNICFLFRSCDEVAICAGCQSGKINCLNNWQCFEHSLLSEESRNHLVLTEGDNIWFSDFTSYSRESPCWMGPGYYRIMPPAGTMISEIKPAANACGTDYGGYLDAESHPEEEGVEVNRKIKYEGSSSTSDITITKCPGGFFVYYLPDVLGNYERYCSM